MESLAYLAPALGCAAMMGAMMWMMNRGAGNGKDKQASGAQTPAKEPDTRAEEIAALRREVDELRSPSAQPVARQDG